MFKQLQGLSYPSTYYTSHGMAGHGIVRNSSTTTCLLVVQSPCVILSRHYKTIPCLPMRCANFPPIGRTGNVSQSSFSNSSLVSLKHLFVSLFLKFPTVGMLILFCARSVFCLLTKVLFQTMLVIVELASATIFI